MSDFAARAAVVIRPATAQDADAIWNIFRLVVAGRDAYVFHPDTPRDVGVGYWFGPEVMSFVAQLDGEVVGMYKLIPNRRDLGDHVSNASFMVHPEAGGRGVGFAMGSHCLVQARRQGYEAMQFNFVVSTNTRAVLLWQRLGFQIVGTLPRAFRHGTLGLVDAYVMHRSLNDVVPVFGTVAQGVTPTVRPSAYAVVANDAGELALIQHQSDVMLPGGAIDEGESAEGAVRREIAEECALDVMIGGSVGRAIQFVRTQSPQPVEKRSEFFAATRPSPIPERIAEHRTMWLRPLQAEQAVTSPSHGWAIRRWMRLHA